MPQPFVDYYEIMQLSPRATPDTVERMYRLLVKRYHPDNPLTGEAARFAAVREAYEVLSSPERRANYDLRHGELRNSQGQPFDQTSAQHDREEDRRILHAILSVLYTERRRRPLNGGLGAVQLERLLSLPEHDLEFPLWYMKQHGWIEILDSGQIAITIAGIDRLADKDMALREDRLLPESRYDAEESFTGPRPVSKVAG